MGNYLEAATPNEATLLEKTLNAVVLPRKKLKKLIADKAYDSDPLRERLADKGIELICPYRCNNKQKRYYDGRKLRRYKRRWKIERTFSWFSNSRRLVVRWERDIVVYSAFFHIACLIMALKRL